MNSSWQGYNQYCPNNIITKTPNYLAGYSLSLIRAILWPARAKCEI
jgi:hypothetical protein